MSFPCELELRTFAEGLRLCRQPVKEIAKLHAREHAWKSVTLHPGENPLAGFSGELLDIRAEIEPGAASEVGLRVRGEPVSYSVAGGKLSSLGSAAPLAPVNGRIQLQILLDRASLEVFGNDGRVSLTSCFLPKPENRSLEVYATGGAAKLVSLRVFELRSIWP
jgi:sucrose-6-phosphate hydrolase SacC (GH32 family)